MLAPDVKRDLRGERRGYPDRRQDAPGGRWRGRHGASQAGSCVPPWRRRMGAPPRPDGPVMGFVGGVAGYLDRRWQPPRPLL